MPKVKKQTRLAGVRNRKAAKRATGKAAKRAVAKAAAKKPAKKRSKTPAARKPAKATPAVAKTMVAIKELDPQQKCGSGTSVQFLYRVDELVDGKRTPHLVFYDHHGWYCEHGRTCPAVGHAKKHNGQFARAS